ncbi:MAG: hypothetical protein ACLGHC_09585 [Alphaproteobacteria bacterium]
MTYGLSSQLFVEDGPAVQAASAASAHNFARYRRGWRSLDSGHRLELVEKALQSPANDFIDALPIAL